MKLEAILKFAPTCVAIWLGSVATVATVACSSADEQPSTASDGGATGAAQRSVEVFSWWIAPGEAEAFQSLVDLNKQLHPRTRVFNAALDSGDNARAELARRLDASDPPDLFQQNAHDIAAFLTQRPGTLQPLDELLAATGLDTAIQSDVLKDVTFGGHVYGLPVNIHRENALFYNKQLFKEAGIAVPTNTTELLAACKTFKSAGVTPIATAHQGWILRILFNSLAMGYMGADAFNEFMSGGARDDVALRGAIDLFDDVLTNYVNDSAGEAEFGWTNAAALVARGEAALFFHGDWAKGFYGQLGWTAGVDFGVVGAPGASDMFWYGVDVFSLPTGAQDAPSAQEFLTTIGSVQGQLAFNKIKGSTPVRLDVPKPQLDTEGRATLDDFVNATYRTFVVSLDVWDAAMLAFAADHDKDALFQAYVEHPPSH